MPCVVGGLLCEICDEQKWWKKNISSWLFLLFSTSCGLKVSSKEKFLGFFFHLGLIVFKIF